MNIYNILAYTYQYQRPEREWWLFDENNRCVEQFPRGAEGKLACVQEAIRRQDYPLFRAANRARMNQPAAISPIWKAAVLVINGHVYAPPEENQTNEIARVRSSAVNLADVYDKNNGYDYQGFYHIVHASGQLHCSCPSFRDDFALQTKSGQRLCKHVLAIMLLANLQRPLAQGGNVSTVQPFFRPDVRPEDTAVPAEPPPSLAQDMENEAFWVAG